MDYYLKAATENDLRTNLANADVVMIADVEVNEAGEVSAQAVRVSAGFSLDVIGQIVKPTGKTNLVDGIEVPEMAPVDGYHANLRGVLSDAQLTILEPVLLETPPSNPYRVWE